jgi:hypothetical protein
MDRIFKQMNNKVPVLDHELSAKLLDQEKLMRSSRDKPLPKPEVAMQIEEFSNRVPTV